MPYRQRIAFMSALLLLGLGYLYAYVPARYLAEEYQPYIEIDEVNLDSWVEDEEVLLGSDAPEYDADDYAAFALDALSDAREESGERMR